MDRSVIIINHYNSLASIGIFSMALKDSLGPTADLYSLYPKRYFSKEKPLHYPGIIDNGIFPENFGLYRLNQIFPGFSHSRLRKKIAEQKRDGGIIHYSSSLMLPLDSSTDNVVSIHDIIFLKETGKDAPALQRKYYEKGLKKFVEYDWIVTPTNSVKQELMQYGVNGHIEAIPYGTANSFRLLPDKIALRRKLNLPLDKTLVLSVSTAVARKNLTIVEKVMDRLGPDFSLVRVGPPVGKCIHFSHAFGDDLNEIYNACDFLLFPTLDEGLGYPMIEAFATGLPVVASDIPVCNEVGGSAVRYVDPFDVAGIIDGVKDVINNPDEFGKLSLQRSSLYTMNAFKERLLGFYGQIH